MITRERIEALRVNHRVCCGIAAPCKAPSCRYCHAAWPCDTYAALTLALEAETIRDRAEREKRDEWREGLVNILDHEGNYLGCMGTTAWRTVGEDAETIRELKAAMEKVFGVTTARDKSVAEHRREGKE